MAFVFIESSSYFKAFICVSYSEDLVELCFKGFGGLLLSGRGVFVSLGIRQKAPFVRTAKLLRKLLDTVVPIPNVKQRGEAGFSQFENGHTGLS